MAEDLTLQIRAGGTKNGTAFCWVGTLQAKTAMAIAAHGWRVSCGRTIPKPLLYR